MRILRSKLRIQACPGLLGPRIRGQVGILRNEVRIQADLGLLGPRIRSLVGILRNEVRIRAVADSHSGARSQDGTERPAYG